MSSLFACFTATTFSICAISSSRSFSTFTTHSRGDVVGDHRDAGRAGHGLVVGRGSRPGSACCSTGSRRGRRRRRSRPRLRRAPGSGACRWCPCRRSRWRSSPTSSTTARSSATSSSSVSVGDLAGGARDDDAVRAVLDQVARERARRGLVDRPVLGERGDHRGQHSFKGSHAASVYAATQLAASRPPRRAGGGRPRGGPPRAGRRCAAGCPRGRAGATSCTPRGARPRSVERQRDRGLPGDVEDGGEDRRPLRPLERLGADRGRCRRTSPSGGGGSPMVGVSSTSWPASNPWRHPREQWCSATAFR